MQTFRRCGWVRAGVGIASIEIETQTNPSGRLNTAAASLFGVRSCGRCSECRAGTCLWRRLRNDGVWRCEKVVGSLGGGRCGIGIGEGAFTLASLTQFLLLEFESTPFFGIADLIEARVNFWRSWRVLGLDDGSEERKTWAAGVASPCRTIWTGQWRWCCKTRLRGARLEISRLGSIG